MRKLFLSLLVIIMTYGVSEAQIVNASQYFNHTSNTHLRGKLRLWNEASSLDSRVSHGLGTEVFHNTYGPGSAYANTIGHRFYVHGNEVVAQFGFGGGGVPANRLTSLINGKVGVNTTVMPGSSSFNVRSHNGVGYGGMSVDIAGAGTNLLPFYSYATNGSVRVWHYFDENDDTWKLYNAGVRLVVKNNGNVGIGTTNPIAPLTVNGKVLAEEVEVVAAVGLNWPDYVFKSDYSLTSLPEVEKFINKNHHLPGVPSEKEVKENGINLGKMDAVLLKKIEELTLYVIELKKENESLKSLADDVKILQEKLDLNRDEK